MSLLGSGMKYICLGKIQSDCIEGEFGVISDHPCTLFVAMLLSKKTLREQKS